MNSPPEPSAAGDAERERICKDVAARANRLTHKSSWQAMPVGEAVDAVMLNEHGRPTRAMTSLAILAKDMDSRDVAIGVVIPGIEHIVFEVVTPQDEVYLTVGGEIVVGLPLAQSSYVSTSAALPSAPRKPDAPKPDTADAPHRPYRAYVAVGGVVLLVIAAVAATLAYRGGVFDTKKDPPAIKQKAPTKLTPR